jgi:flagellar protein FliO/FliZ
MALLALILLLPWLVKWLRQSGWKVLKPVHQPLRLVSALAVGPQQKVVVVEISRSGVPAQWLVLGVTPQSISRLDVLNAESTALSPHSEFFPAGFAAHLADHLGGTKE